MEIGGWLSQGFRRKGWRAQDLMKMRQLFPSEQLEPQWWGGRGPCAENYICVFCGKRQQRALRSTAGKWETNVWWETRYPVCEARAFMEPMKPRNACVNLSVIKELKSRGFTGGCHFLSSPSFSAPVFNELLSPQQGKAFCVREWKLQVSEDKSQFLFWHTCCSALHWQVSIKMTHSHQQY